MAPRLLKSGEVASGLGQASHKSKLDQITASEKYDRNCRRRGLRRLDRRAIGDDHAHPATNEIARQVRQSIVTTFRPAVLDCDVASRDMAGFAQALAECAQDGARIPSGRLAVQKP